ncbi:hypothetical protein D7U98_00925 [Stenotrophomonas maltophilia]|uniref:hypothetical protein n=1 Tax=Stenotrophomonas maltophilia TaxID=40324 RepID=UPI0002C53D11|nr:hypothetical protein [Stenotrophomonas maltophilia]MBA0393970.1 hypothetical protein [Stenotrophomonas maltophilia]QGL76288.1 hypothetical protein FEO95_11930 [Stenotrophomonas maltophilia]CCP16646.1 hypothetical protein SMRA8_2456 [Stenotrophomonas maltophilia RA8]
MRGCQRNSAISVHATADRILPAMHSPSSPPDFMTATRPSGWVQSGDRWDLWWNGRCVASVVPHAVLGVRLFLDTRKSPQPKVVAAVNARQAKRYAERWCAARLCPQLRLRDAVARLVDKGTPSPPAPTREQRQQARRLAEAGAGEMGRIKAALAPRPSAMLTKPEVPGRGGAWSIPGQAPSTRLPDGNAFPDRATPKVLRARSLPLR